MVALSIKVPALWAPLFGAVGDVAVAHAALDCRAADACLAVALSQEGDVALRAPPAALARVELMLQEWAPGARLRKVGDARSLTIGGTRLWLADRDEALARIPAPTLSALVLCDAHLLSQDPRDAAGRRLVGPTVATGEFPGRGHWFRALLESAPRSARLPVGAVLAAFPDQAPLALSPGDAGFEPRMELRDAPRVARALFATCRARLRVRTDKSPASLTASQRAEASDQLGDEWEGRSGTAPVVSLDPLPLQRRYLAMKEVGRRRGFRKFICIKYRRGGITTLEQAISYLACDTPHTYVAAIGDTDSKSRRIFHMVSMFHDRDPQAIPLAGRPSETKLSLANGSYFFVGTAGGKGVNRGDSLQRAHGFEVPYWCEGPRQAEDVEALMAGIGEACGRGEVSLEGTPNGREWAYHTYSDAKRGQNDFWPIFLRWFDDPLNVAAPGTFDAEEVLGTLTTDELALIAKHPRQFRPHLAPAMIAFRRQKQLALRRLFSQEYPEDDEACFLTSGHCFFDALALLAALERAPDYERKHLPGGFEVEWEAPQAGVEYVLGADTSEGIPGCDPNGVAVARRDTGAQVAAAHGLFKPDVLAGHIARLSRRFNNALTGVERENHGHAVLQKCVELGMRPHFEGGSLYYFKARPAQPNEDRAKRLERVGWSTNAVTRPLMLDDLSDLLDAGVGVRDRDLLAECLTFRLQSSGKFEADSGSHDDVVMKWAVCYQMRKHRRVKPSISMLEGSLP